MEISMTKTESEVQVLFNGELLIVDFPFDYSIINKIREVDGAVWNEVITKKWTVPRKNYKNLVKAFEGLGGRVSWKTPDELKRDASELSIHEESLEDVLNRIPKKIDTSYLKIEPYDFQKVAVGWAVTPKGKKGNIQGGLLADLMG